MIRTLVFWCLIVVTLTDDNYCIYKGKAYRLHMIFFAGCNACLCTNVQDITCNIQGCKYYGVAEEDFTETCVKNGKVYELDQTFSIDSCKKCICQRKNKISCERESCTEDGCYYKGKFYKRGTTLKLSCFSCFCSKKGNECYPAPCFFSNRIY